METYGTITPKFQIHLPVAIRKKSGIVVHGRVRIMAEKGKITISGGKRKSILDFQGSVKVKNPIPAEKIRDYIDYSEI